MVINSKHYKYYILITLVLLYTGTDYYYTYKKSNYSNSTSNHLTVIGNSMYPTFKDGQEIRYTSSYDKKEITNGTVVIFYLPKDPDHLMVKRVIGVEGNLVEIKDNTLYRNKEEVEVNKNDNNSSYYIYEMSKNVDKDEVFVIGDNYNNSKDSRNYGTIPLSSIKGIVKE